MAQEFKEIGSESWVDPPAEILERLLELARFGDMDQIQTEAMALANHGSLQLGCSILVSPAQEGSQRYH